MTKAYEGTRMIHVRLPEGLHKALRVRAAEADVTINNLVASILATELDWTPPEKSKGKRKK